MRCCAVLYYAMQRCSMLGYAVLKISVAEPQCRKKLKQQGSRGRSHLDLRISLAQLSLQLPACTPTHVDPLSFRASVPPNLESLSMGQTYYRLRNDQNANEIANKPCVSTLLHRYVLIYQHPRGRYVWCFQPHS